MYRRGGRGRYVLLLLVLTAVTLITLDRRSDDSGPLGVLGRLAHEVVSPVGGAVDAVTTPVADWFDGITSAGSLKRENKELREQLAEAKAAARRGEAAVQENRQLNALLGLQIPEGIETIPARVTAGSPGNYEWTITINRGSSDGVIEGMPVVGDEGLVGRVVDVWRSGAKVLLVTDPRSGVSIRMTRGRATGEAEGRAGADTLALDIVDSEAEIIEGDDAQTSGLQGSSYPPGIPVGEVESMEAVQGDLVRRVLLRPFVDLDRVEYVRVLRWPTAAAAATEEATSPLPPPVQGTEGE